MTVKWRDTELMLLVAKGLDRAVDGIALQVVGHAKNNIERNGQVDTGFMVNSGYVVGQGVNTYAPANVEDKRALSPQSAPENGAVAGFAAEYSLINETKKPFLWTAVEQTAAQAPGIVAKEIKL